jgi:hypothetical protein
VLRSLGYLLVTLLYVALLLVVLAIWVGPFLAVDDGVGAGVDVQGAVSDAVVVLIAGPVLGIALVLLTGITSSLAALGGLAFVRSFDPAYAGTRLTRTTWSRTTVGAPPGRRAASSLLPTAPGRWASFWTKVNERSLGPDHRLVGASALVGVGYLVVLGAVRW